MSKPRPMPNDATVAGLKQLIANLRRKKKGTEHARRCRIEAIARYESWIPELERKEAQEAYEARQRQIKENGERLRAEVSKQPPKETEENLGRIAGQDSAQAAGQQKRPVFYFRNSDEYYFRGGYGELVPAKIKKLSNGEFIDAADNEPVRIVETFPSPCRGSVLLDNGDWRLPEIKHPVVAPLPTTRDQSFVGWRPNPDQAATERIAAKVQKLGYPARVGMTDCKVYCLYDNAWIPLADWQAKMGIDL